MFPTVKSMRVVPVAGYDSFLLNLSGGHAPWFVRCVLILEDSAGNQGVGEIPSSDGIIKGLEQCRSLVEGSQVNNVKQIAAERDREILQAQAEALKVEKAKEAETEIAV